MYHLKCIECGAEYSKDEVIYTCRKCDGLLDVIYDYSSIKIDMEKLKTECPSVWKYAKLLPIEREPVTIRKVELHFTNATVWLRKSGLKNFM